MGWGAQGPPFSLLPPQAGALQRIQVVRAFDIFQMLGALQDLRGAVSQQVSLTLCLPCSPQPTYTVCVWAGVQSGDSSCACHSQDGISGCLILSFLNSLPPRSQAHLPH